MGKHKKAVVFVV